MFHKHLYFLFLLDFPISEMISASDVHTLEEALKGMCKDSSPEIRDKSKVLLNRLSGAEPMEL